GGQAEEPMSLQDTIAIRPVAETLRRAQAGKSYWTRVRERLLAYPVTVTVVALLLCIIVMVLAAPLIATHDPSAASVFARLKSPGYPGTGSGPTRSDGTCGAASSTAGA